MTYIDNIHVGVTQDCATTTDLTSDHLGMWNSIGTLKVDRAPEYSVGNGPDNRTRVIESEISPALRSHDVSAAETSRDWSVTGVELGA